MSSLSMLRVAALQPLRQAGKQASCFLGLDKKNISTTPQNGVQFCKTPLEAVKDIKDGSKIMVGGFSTCGLPENLIDGLLEAKTKDLTVVSQFTGLCDHGLGLLFVDEQVKKMVTSYIGNFPLFQHQHETGRVELELVPQGTLAERIRCGGAGIPAFFTPTGWGTAVHKGQLTTKYDKQGKPAEKSKEKESRKVGDKDVILEEAITADFALIKAWKADKAGNLIFRASARNFNLPMSKASKLTIAEVDEVVDELPPGDVQIPHIYVDKIIVGKPFKKKIENLTYTVFEQGGLLPRAKTDAQSMREIIARRLAVEFKSGQYVNLGPGLPTQASHYVKPDVQVHLLSDSGVLDVGPYPFPGEEDVDLINHAAQSVTLRKGGSFVSSDEALAMVRGNHVDMVSMGALQVSAQGDVANIAAGTVMKGIGGSMDIAAKTSARRIVAMKHLDKHGNPKIVDKCTLPLTGVQCADMLITDKAVFTFVKGKITLVEIAEGETVETIQKLTHCKFEVAKDVKKMQQLLMPGEKESDLPRVKGKTPIPPPPAPGPPAKEVDPASPQWLPMWQGTSTPRKPSSN